MHRVDTDLKSPLARAVVRYVQDSLDHPFAMLISAEHRDDRDVVDVGLEPELVQDRRVAIIPREPVRIVFEAPDDSVQPLVRSLRPDFPEGQVHTNLVRDADGLALCVWEENWHDLSRTMTVQMLIERIRAWLAAMASGRLHTEDQSLEPLLPASVNTLVIPPGTMTGPWHIAELHNRDGRYIMLLSEEAPAEAKRRQIAIFHRDLPSQVHRALAERPYDLGALCKLLTTFGVDLMKELAQWLCLPEQTARASNQMLVLMFAIPLRRTADGPNEVLEVWAYSAGETVASFGEKLGITLTHVEGRTAGTAKNLGPRPDVDLTGIPLPGWRVVQRLDRATARRYSAFARTENPKLVAIGAGAIGSNIVMNTVRVGIGEWTVIDNDIVLPHNTVRQTQTNLHVGSPKAETLRDEANLILAEVGVTAIVADLLLPDGKAEEIDTALKASDLVVDFSASPAVTGHLADQDLKRAASFFFSPDGADLVVLAEDAKRELRLDDVEAQYFLTVATTPILYDHLSTARMDAIRYANACQDLSRPLPPWQVQMLCGLASGQLVELLGRESAQAQIWRLKPESGAITPVPIALKPVHRFGVVGQRVIISDGVIERIRSLRKQAEPNETGGVLIGTYDLVRGVVHVLEALSAPADSRQSPTYFVRGAKDLLPLVNGLADRTAGRLRYVGEWHSHPDGAAARPSADDEKVFQHLRANLGPAGSPYAMMICGGERAWFRMGWAEREALEGELVHGRG